MKVTRRTKPSKTGETIYYTISPKQTKAAYQPDELIKFLKTKGLSDESLDKVCKELFKKHVAEVKT